MLNVQTNVALSRRIRNITAYSLCMLGTVSDCVTPGMPEPGACIGQQHCLRRAKLQLSRSMIS